jgi:hypothetical protein
MMLSLCNVVNDYCFNHLGFDRKIPVDHYFGHNKDFIQPHSYCVRPCTMSTGATNKSHQCIGAANTKKIWKM